MRDRQEVARDRKEVVRGRKNTKMTPRGTWDGCVDRGVTDQKQRHHHLSEAFHIPPHFYPQHPKPIKHPA